MSIKNILTAAKGKVKEFIDETTVEDIAVAAIGTTAALAVICGYQGAQISELNKKVKVLDKTIKGAADIGYANDCKAYNNNLLTTYALEAVINCVKGTHPGVVPAVDEAIRNAQLDFIDYSGMK